MLSGWADQVLACVAPACVTHQSMVSGPVRNVGLLELALEVVAEILAEVVVFGHLVVVSVVMILTSHKWFHVPIIETSDQPKTIKMK